MKFPQKEVLMNTISLHLHSFCAAGMNSSLATKVTLTVTGEDERVVHGGGPGFDFISVL
jgi:hypothetical protein